MRREPFVSRGHFKALYAFTDDGGTVMDVLRRVADVIERRGIADRVDRVTATEQSTEEGDSWWQAEVMYDDCEQAFGCEDGACQGGKVGG